MFFDTGINKRLEVRLISDGPPLLEVHLIIFTKIGGWSLFFKIRPSSTQNGRNPSYSQIECDNGSQSDYQTSI